jgi:nucleotide-binding universal stress UspA family protein/predicted transcriptional regulator
MRVKTLMRTQFAVVSDETPLDQARAVIARESLEAVPVLRAGALVGLLRARDIERLGPSAVPSLAAHDWAWRPETMTAGAVALRDVVALAPEASVQDAIDVLADQDLEACPVVEGSTVVGLVTTRDLLAILLEFLEAERASGLDHVLVAVDFDEGTAAAVATGLALAREHGAHLTLLHVLAPPPFRVLGEGVPGDMVYGTRRLQREQLLAECGALLPAAPGVRINSVVVTGDPLTEVTQAAALHAADLIVVGTRSHRHWFRPCPVEALVARAPCPVLVVRPGAAIAGEGARR